MVEQDPTDRQDGDRRNPVRRRGGGGRAVGRSNLYRMLSAPTPSGRGWQEQSRSRVGEVQVHRSPSRARRRLLGLQVRGARRGPFGCRKTDVPGPRAHLFLTAPPLQCCPRRRCRSSRSTPTICRSTFYRSSGPVVSSVNHDRLGCADHPQALGNCGSDVGREVPAAEPEKGLRVLRRRLYDQALANSRPSWLRTAASQVWHRDRAEKDPHLQLR